MEDLICLLATVRTLKAMDRLTSMFINKGEGRSFNLLEGTIALSNGFLILNEMVAGVSKARALNKP